MSWFDTVPAWVLQLLQEYAIPDDAQVQTGVDFDAWGSDDGATTSTTSQFTADYPGIVPSYSLEPVIIPQTTGVQYILKAKKGVGFYACKTEVISYEAGRINSWEFPLDQKKFGWLTLGRSGTVLSEHRITYAKQIHTCTPALLLLLNYDDQFNPANLLNSADKLTATQIAVRLSPTVKIRYSFLPTWEVWAVSFFRQSNV
jgi:hypothetical protein